MLLRLIKIENAYSSKEITDVRFKFLVLELPTMTTFLIQQHSRGRPPGILSIEIICHAQLSKKNLIFSLFHTAGFYHKNLDSKATEDNTLHTYPVNDGVLIDNNRELSETKFHNPLKSGNSAA